MRKFVLFALAIRLLLLTCCMTASVSGGSVSKRGNVQLCGRMLTAALHLLCEGQYYDPSESNAIERRTIDQQQLSRGIFGGDFYPAWYLGPTSPRLAETGRHQYPNQYQYPASRRQERGVVDECCKNACSPTVLLSYCRYG